MDSFGLYRKWIQTNLLFCISHRMFFLIYFDDSTHCMSITTLRRIELIDVYKNAFFFDESRV